jgi:hypothetical protein
LDDGTGRNLNEVADVTKSVNKKGREFADGVNALHTDTVLTDVEKVGLQALMKDALQLLGGADRYLDRNVTATANIARGTSPSLSFSITTG